MSRRLHPPSPCCYQLDRCHRAAGTPGSLSSLVLAVLSLLSFISTCSLHLNSCEVSKLWLKRPHSALNVKAALWPTGSPDASRCTEAFFPISLRQFHPLCPGLCVHVVQADSTHVSVCLRLEHLLITQQGTSEV